VRAAPNRARVADRWVSLLGGGHDNDGSQNAMRTTAARSLAWMRGIEGGAVEERVWHSGVDEGIEAKRGPTAADAFYGSLVARAERKKGRGVRQRSGTWHRLAVGPALTVGRRPDHVPADRGLAAARAGGTL
jgi:hypothetical protein